ncbi:unnamed protein product [Nezara viridula]|uniref:Ornithine aminotransferase n=1 Tax=Nezara viridula TaxID=85310 RepID=A0A9P0MTT4_NEZVI|nr:unnamed protein product [Nezara viridula]
MMYLFTKNLWSIFDKVQNQVLKTQFQNWSSSKDMISKEEKPVAHRFDPLPVVKSKGNEVSDKVGKRYLDFIARFASFNFGHYHPRILKMFKKQGSMLSSTERVDDNHSLPKYAEVKTKDFNHGCVVPMTTGIEGGETAVQLPRYDKGYRCKNIPDRKAGKTWESLSTNNKNEAQKPFGPWMKLFGPWMPGFKFIYSFIEFIHS